MKTILKGRSGEVVIDTEGPVVIIGESINPTRRKKLVETLSAGNFEFVHELAKVQIQAGADVLDVNVGYPGVEDEKLLPETVKSIQENFDVPLCIDSPNPKAIEAALKVADGRCLINSVNGEEKSLDAILPIAKEYGAAVIGLVMDDDGITHDPRKRLSIADKILERAMKIGLKAEDIIIDPLAMAVSADQQACLVTLETIRLVREKLGLNMTEGSSNVSFGLPNREMLNNAFITLSILNGVTCPIANPVKVTATIRSADILLGKDEMAMRFIEYYQSML
jgi:5-methyltetrahydrofolate--homocysteine methyltransferase